MFPESFQSRHVHRRVVAVRSDGEEITFDGGALLHRQADLCLDLIESVVNGLSDPRWQSN